MCGWVCRWVSQSAWGAGGRASGLVGAGGRASGLVGAGGRAIGLGVADGIRHMCQWAWGCRLVC